jgi:hypothetical protein
LIKNIYTTPLPITHEKNNSLKSHSEPYLDLITYSHANNPHSNLIQSNISSNSTQSTKKNKKSYLKTKLTSRLI